MAPSHVLRGFRRALNWIPVILVNLVVGWSYYAYVVELCVHTVPNNEERISYLVVFHVFFFMFLWSYWKTIIVRPAFPSKAFCLPKAEKELYEKEESSEAQQEILRRVARELPVFTQTAKGAIRYCDHCQIIKPDRTHHCSTCEMCVLKMDHHCPWVNTCVGWSNYKFFILFLAYGSMFCAVISGTVVQYFIEFWTIRMTHAVKRQQLPENHAKFHIIFLFFVAFLFFLSMMCLLTYHLWLLGKNRTTIEAFSAPVFSDSGPDKHGYNIGFCRNVAEVFGEQKLSWFVPVFSSIGDGHSFVTRLVHIDPERANAILQQNGKTDGQLVSVKVEN